MFGQRSGKVRWWKFGRIEKFCFFLMCLVGAVEKWEGEKLFYLVGEKSGRMENVVYMNWLLCEEMGKWRVGEYNKDKDIFVIYYSHHFFLLSFSPKLGGQNYVGPEGLFSTPFSFSLVFSPEPNKRKFHFSPYFPLLFHPPCFHPNQTRPNGFTFKQAAAVLSIFSIKK